MTKNETTSLVIGNPVFPAYSLKMERPGKLCIRGALHTPYEGLISTNQKDRKLDVYDWQLKGSHSILLLGYILTNIWQNINRIHSEKCSYAQ